MIGVSQISVASFRGGGGAAPNPDFISEWDTTQAGSASDTVVLPLLSGGTYSGTIDWGDGNSDSLSYANRTHLYASSGTYTITITATTFEGWRFNNSGDKAKIIDISNWGTLNITTDAAFTGCSNLDISATDAPTISSTTMFRMFRTCSSLTTPDLTQWDVSGVLNASEIFNNCSNFNGDIGSWDVSSVINMRAMFFNCTTFNQDISGWDTSSVNFFGSVFANTGMFQNAFAFNQPIGSWNVTSATDFARMFQSATSFNQDISGWDTTNATNMAIMLNNADAYDQSLAGLEIINVTDIRFFLQNAPGLSTANYDATLIDWEAQLQAAYPGGVGYGASISTDFGSSTYTLGSAAETARTSLISTFGWTITDGGGV